MIELNSLEEIDSYGVKHPNAVLVIYDEKCPFCQAQLKDLEKLEKEQGIPVLKIKADKALWLMKKINSSSVPVTLVLKECDIANIVEGYKPKLVDELVNIYADARPICKIDLSKKLLENTLLGEPILL